MLLCLSTRSFSEEKIPLLAIFCHVETEKNTIGG